MSFSVGVGKSNFAALREANNYYVDKTDFIYELSEGAKTRGRFRKRM